MSSPDARRLMGPVRRGGCGRGRERRTEQSHRPLNRAGATSAPNRKEIAMSRSIQSRAPRALRLVSPAVATAAALFAAHAALASYTQTNLVSDGFVPAAHTDPNLKNPWGASSDPSGGPFWISNQVTGTATVYNSAG